MKLLKAVLIMLNVIPLAVGISTAAMNMQQESYTHHTDGKVEFRESKEFVICDNCDNASSLTKKIKPKLSIKFTGEENKNERATETETSTVIHYQAPDTVPFTVYFGYDKHDLEDDEEEKLQGLAEILIKDGYNEFESVGYTDNKGPEEYNLMLSGKRAEAVKMKLSSLGGSPSKTEGRGKCCTLSSDDESRRVEILFKKGGKND